MADAGFFKGTSTDQDRRFSDKELKLLKTIKFPSEFDKKVDMRKVNLQVIRPWITKKVVELVGFEDEVVVEYAMGLLEDESQPTPDPKKMQINLTGFLTSSTPAFMAALWSLLLEAQGSPAGIPRSFVEEKKAEMRSANRGDERVLEERERRRLDEIRERERAQRDRDGGGSGGRGRGKGRGGRGGWDEPRRGRDNGWGARGGRPPRQSRTPPKRRSLSYSRSPPRRRRRSYTPIRSSRSISRSASFSHSSPRRRRTPPSLSPTPPLRDARGSPAARLRERDRPRASARSATPPARDRAQASRVRSRSRTPPKKARHRVRERVRSPPPPPRPRRSPSRSLSRSRSRSRSRSPPPQHRDRGRHHRSPVRRSSAHRSPARRSPVRRSSPHRRRRRSPPRSDHEMAERAPKRRRRSPSVASSVGGGSVKDRGGGGESKRLIDRMDAVGAAERDGKGRRTTWEERLEGEASKQALARMENELKEKALRQKVVRTRDRRRSRSGERN